MEKQSSRKFPSIDFIFLLAVTTVSVAAIALSLKKIMFFGQADEGYYLKYATLVGTKGVSVFPALCKEYVAHQEYWQFPNPLRIGFILISSLWLKMLGYSFLNLTLLSVVSFSAFLYVSYYFIKKYFGQAVAMLSAILLAFSPLQMAIARRALMDATANLFTVLSVWFFFENTKERNRAKIFLFVCVYSFAILIRENTILLTFFFLVYLFVRGKSYKIPLRASDVLSVTVFPCIVVAGVYLLAAGKIANVIAVAKIVLKSPDTNQYAILFGSGPWFRYLADYLVLSPWALLLAVGFFFYCIVKRDGRQEWLYFSLLCVTTLFVFSFFTKNVRYVLILDMPIRLFAVLMLFALLGGVPEKKKTIVLALIVFVIALLDYSSFYTFFIKNRIYDPMTYKLFKAAGMVP